MPDSPLHACALITGASAGLGKEFAIQLAPHCRRVVLVARREAALRELEARLRADNPELGVGSLVVDLSRGEERRNLIESVAGTEWAPSLLVNNAGMGDYGEFATANWEKLQQLLDVNIVALTHLTHGFLADLKRAERGAILNVSSLSCLLPIPDCGIYAASKAYVTSFSEALRLELRDHGIPVLAACPGPVPTEFDRTAQRTTEMPEEKSSRDWFYVPKEQVVRESLAALERGRARVYPGWKVALVAAGISLLPLIAIRYVMSHRPRSIPNDGP